MSSSAFSLKARRAVSEDAFGRSRVTVTFLSTGLYCRDQLAVPIDLNRIRFRLGARRHRLDNQVSPGVTVMSLERFRRGRPLVGVQLEMMRAVAGLDTADLARLPDFTGVACVPTRRSRVKLQDATGASVFSKLFSTRFFSAHLGRSSRARLTVMPDFAFA